MPEWVAEILEPLYRNARISEYIDSLVSGFRGPLCLTHDRIHGAHERNNSQRNKAIANPPKFGKRVVVGPNAVELKCHIVVKKSPARTIGKQNLSVDPVAIQRFQALRGLVDFKRSFLPALRIVTAFFHRRGAIADIAALNLTIDDPALDRS